MSKIFVYRVTPTIYRSPTFRPGPVNDPFKGGRTLSKESSKDVSGCLHMTRGRCTVGLTPVGQGLRSCRPLSETAVTESDQSECPVRGKKEKTPVP